MIFRRGAATLVKSLYGDYEATGKVPPYGSESTKYSTPFLFLGFFGDPCMVDEYLQLEL